MLGVDQSDSLTRLDFSPEPSFSRNRLTPSGFTVSCACGASTLPKQGHICNSCEPDIGDTGDEAALLAEESEPEEAVRVKTRGASLGMVSLTEATTLRIKSGDRGISVSTPFHSGTN